MVDESGDVYRRARKIVEINVHGGRKTRWHVPKTKMRYIYDSLVECSSTKADASGLQGSIVIRCLYIDLLTAMSTVVQK